MNAEKLKKFIEKLISVNKEKFEMFMQQGRSEAIENLMLMTDGKSEDIDIILKGLGY